MGLYNNVLSSIFTVEIQNNAFVSIIIIILTRYMLIGMKPVGVRIFFTKSNVPYIKLFRFNFYNISHHTG